MATILENGRRYCIYKSNFVLLHYIGKNKVKPLKLYSKIDNLSVLMAARLKLSPCIEYMEFPKCLIQ